MTILDDLIKELPRSPYSCNFVVGFDARQARAVKRAAKGWPRHSLGCCAAHFVREGRLLDCEDAYYIREAILGRHYRHGVYRLK